jgi:conjugal transfer pilus assembly protein TraF
MNDQKKKTSILIWMAIIFVSNVSMAGNIFYNDRERGWYYRECADCKDQSNISKNLNSKKQPKLSLREMDAEQVLETLESVQKEMQVRQARFTLEPNIENARDFLDYQRLMFKNGGEASEVMKTVLIKYPYLDSRIDSPISQQAIKIKTLESNAANDLKIKEFAQHFKLFYFFKPNCSYCKEFQPVLETIIKNYGFEVEAISSDGKKLDSLLPIITKIDNGLSSKLKVETYPTIIAYNKKHNIYLPVSRGFLPTEDLKNNILHVFKSIVNLSMEVK